MLRLQDKVVLISGAGSGLGRESSVLFAEEGATVVVTDIDGQRAQDTLELVEKNDGRAIALTVDVTSEDDIRRAVDHTVETYGRLDVMFANAGINQADRGLKDIDEFTEAAFDKVVGVNLKGVFLCAKHAVRVMKPRRTGTILATSSAASFMAYPGVSVYGATKGGVNMLVKGLAIDLGKYGIRINAVCPANGMSPNFFLGKGYSVVGRSYEQVAAEQAGKWDASIKPIPLRLGTPPNLRDNALAALFLASDDSRYMSGVCLPATDGGLLSKVAMDFPEGWQNQWYEIFGYPPGS
jgi:NAD(P)-dependent dehydrogenase (short-subunit alcohol dehydrogenase family)